MRTTHITKPAEVERQWWVVDAEGQTLGRLASQVAHVLRGKHKPIFSPSVDTGDYVIVVNAEKVNVTGKKLEQKLYRRHSGYIGGFKEVPLKVMLAKKPEEVLRHAVKGMLPKNNLGRAMLRKLKIVVGPTHNHEAQQPQKLDFSGIIG